jgi:hypothetical protein
MGGACDHKGGDTKLMIKNRSILASTVAAVLAGGTIAVGLGVAQQRPPQAAQPGSLEQRVRVVEDKLAIYELIAAHPPSADTASGFYVDYAFRPEARFDRGPAVPGAEGRDAIRGLITRPEHRQAIEALCRLPLIELRGDEAYVTSYLALIHYDREAPSRALANHGDSNEHRIHHLQANRWRFVRTPQGWKIQSRTFSPLNGSEQARGYLSQGLERYRRP